MAGVRKKEIPPSKPHWTWYDYKMACVQAIYKRGFVLRYTPQERPIIVTNQGRIVYKIPKGMSWKEFYETRLEGVIE